MIRLPSLFSLWQQFRNVLFRFPLQSILALTAMSLALWVSDPDTHNEYPIYKLIALCNLAFTSSLAANLYGESNKWKPIRIWIIQFIALILCAILFFLLSPEIFRADLLRLGLFILSGHLLVSFSNYSTTTKTIEFWHFNKTLFLRFITAVIFSMVLFAGLSIALSTIDALFNYNVRGEVYFRLFIIIGVGFNSLFFLAGVPEASDYIEISNSTPQTKLNIDYSYPKVLKIFTQYVLIPLLTIYFGILVVYELKIAINFQLPDGLVSILILGYAVFGILSYLLIYPISKDTGNEWMRQFSGLFFWLMLPLLLLLFIAIGVRVEEYGITEPRYFIILLAVWLLGITLYFIINKSPRIQLIPITLFIVTLLATYGPQSATSLSKRSQQSRLLEYFPKKDKLASAEKVSIINYLVDYHGLTAIQKFTKKDLKNIQHGIVLVDSIRNNNYLLKSKLRDTAFSLLAVDQNSYDSNIKYINFLNEEKGISNTNFDYAFWIEYGNLDEEFKSPIGNIQVFTVDTQSVVIKIGEADSLLFNMNSFQKELIKRYQSQTNAGNRSANGGNKNEIRLTNNNNAIIPANWMTLKANNEHFQGEIRVQSISFDLVEEKKATLYLSPFSGFVLVKRK